MTTHHELQRVPGAPALMERAAADLSFIRGAMASSGRFTAVPGWGGACMGLIAWMATGIASSMPAPQDWLGVWVAAACVAFTIGASTMWVKARRQGVSLTSGVGRKFLLGLCPSLLAGVVITAILWDAGAAAWLPVTWLVLYGSAILSAGSLSVPVVPFTGAAFMLLGGVAACCPSAWHEVFLGYGFTGLHLFCGLWIAHRHGG